MLLDSRVLCSAQAAHADGGAEDVPACASTPVVPRSAQAAPASRVGEAGRGGGNNGDKGDDGDGSKKRKKKARTGAKRAGGHARARAMDGEA